MRKNSISPDLLFKETHGAELLANTHPADWRNPAPKDNTIWS